MPCPKRGFVWEYALHPVSGFQFPVLTFAAMRKWILKAVLQKAISFLPGGYRLNYLFQKYITRGVRLSDLYFEDRLAHLRQHLAYSGKYLGGPEGLRVLELGTGWYPVIPVGLYLAGVRQITTVDISRLMDKEKVVTTIGRFLDYYRLGRLEELFPNAERVAELGRLWEQSGSLPDDELHRRLRLVYLVADARDLPLAGGSADLIVSNNTFEHIYPDVLRDILREFRRVLRPGGLMSHFIDMSDHFAHLDPSISIYNFLRFSGRSWRWIDNTIQPQNRWRMSQYRALYRELDLPVTEEQHRPGDPSALRQVPVDAAFAGIPEEELAISHGYLVSLIEP